MKQIYKLSFLFMLLLMFSGRIWAQTPPVYAGPDTLLCYDDLNYEVIYASVTPTYTTVTWTTSGDGSWDTDNEVNTTYYPSSNDRAEVDGFVTLTLTAVNGTILVGSDDMKLYLPPKPVVTDASIQYSATDGSGWEAVGGSLTGDYSVCIDTTETYYYFDMVSTTDNFDYKQNTYNPFYVDQPAPAALMTYWAAKGVNSGSTGAGGHVYDMITGSEPIFYVMYTGSDYQLVDGFQRDFLNDGDHNFRLDPVPTGSYSYTGQVESTDGCFTEDLTFNLDINHAAYAYAGPDTTICRGVSYTVADATANYTSVTWGTSGNGNFSNETSLTPTYTLGASDTISVTLTLYVDGDSPCTQVSDEMTLTIQERAAAYAGENATICEGETFTLTDALASHQSEIQWTSGGCGKGMWAGSFDDSTAQNPTFTPSQDAIDDGCVTLKMEVFNISPCDVAKGPNTNSDFLTLIIIGKPTIDAGADETICADVDYSYDASPENCDSIQWTTSGSGSFSDDESETGTYTPSVADTTAGSIYLYVTGYPIMPCAASVKDSLLLSFEPTPIANAGSDGTTCEGVPYTLNGSAQNYTSVSWTSNGGGSFDDNTKFAAKYTPADGDSPSVTLTLHVQPNSPCAVEATDDMILSVGDAPDVEAGNNQNICESGTTVTGTAANSVSTLWTTYGDGTFVDKYALSTKYTPGSGDKISGSVKLELVAQGQAPCDALFSDDIWLYITQDLPTVSAGPDVTACENVPYTISGSSADDYSQLVWIKLNADGTFDDNTELHPEYTFGSNDKSQGFALLKLVASPESPCTLLVEDQVKLSVQKAPTANAGNDASICADDTYNLTFGNGVTAANYSSLAWYTTQGSGTFEDDDELYPEYTPGPTDLINESVDLILLAAPISPCATATSDTMTLTINPLPEVSSASLRISEANTGNWSAVSGTFATGYDLCLDGDAATNYWLDVDAFASTVDLEQEVYNAFFIDTDEVPDDFYSYWNDKGVNAGATSGWQAVMWDIINGDDPVFYLYADYPLKNGYDYRLIDGFQKQYNSQDVAMTVPGDYPQGDYVFVGTVMDVNGCESEEFDIDLSITHAPMANAGSDYTICADGSFTLSDASASNYSSVTWAAGGCNKAPPGAGDGTWSPDPPSDTLKPTYTPGPQDINNGSVCLSLTAEPISPCTVAASDYMILTIQGLPVANAGNSGEICEDDSFPLTTASADNYQSVSWTGGTGTFDNAGVINTTYNAGSGEVGTVVLTLTAEPKTPCQNSVSDTMTLIIHSTPTANAGSDADICEDGTYTVSGASAEDAGSVYWTTDGDGSIDDGTTLSPTYIAAPGETGKVTLTLYAVASSPCTGEVSDDMEITIQAKPLADAGIDGTICADGSFTVSGASVDNADSFQWTAGTCVDSGVGGDGSWENESTLTPTYTPGENDIANGSVCLTLEALPETHCTVSAYSTNVVTINALPELTALDLQYGYVPTASTSASGDLDNGFQICLDGVEGSHYNLDVNTLTASESLDQTAMNAFYHTATVPSRFSTYWNDRGVNASATGWQGIMWDIINGNAPIFYLVYNGSDYALIDGLQYQNTPSDSVPLILPGNYPQGDYTFNGTIKDVNGCISEELSVDIAFVHAAISDAGSDATIADNQSHTLADATAFNYQSVSWGTSGNGGFDDDQILNPVYTPGAGDAGNVITLSLYVDPLAPCAQQATSTMQLTVKHAPVVTITAPTIDQELYDYAFTIAGTATDADGTIAGVQVKLNDGAWNAPTGLDTWEQDTAFVPGLNTVSAFAIDDEGYHSDTVSVSAYLNVHEIALYQGWQLISTYLDPLAPNDVPALMSDVVDDLTIMFSLSGMYAPAPFNINTIGNWDIETGYKLKMEADQTLVIAGDPLDDNSMSFPAGVHYLPVPTDQPTSLLAAIADASVNVRSIIDIRTGLVYWPGGNLNSLTEFLPGVAYLANFINPVDVEFAPYQGHITDNSYQMPEAPVGPWTINRTAEVHVMAIEQDALAAVGSADYIGAFDSEGNCIGFAQLNTAEGNIALMLYGNDEYTETKDGALEGEQIAFVAYNSLSGDEETLIAAFDPKFAAHDGSFQSNGTSIITKLYKSSTGVGEAVTEHAVRLYPNPAQGLINISLAGGIINKVEFLNADGSLVKTSTPYSEQVKINVSDLAGGVYFVKVYHNDGTTIQKLVIR